MIPVDANSPCGSLDDPALYDFRVARPPTARTYAGCRSSARPCPTAAATTRSSSAGRTEDNFGPITVPAGHLWLMGDNRDDSADSRVAEWQGGLGGPVPWENIGGRAEFITFSLDGSTVWWNPLTWFEALRSGRAGNRCGTIDGQEAAATLEPHVERPGPAEFRDPFVRREMRRAAVWFGMVAGWSPASSSLPSRCC